MNKNIKIDPPLAYQHNQKEGIGVLMVNLGTPDSPASRDVRRYLKEFLWDSRVVEVPRLPWWLMLHLVILNLRPRRSARAYARVWTQQGSPLLVISKRQSQALQVALSAKYGVTVPVVLAMRYGGPSIKEGLSCLQQAGVGKILVLPLYPQYSATTTASVFDAVTGELRRWRRLPELRFINHYHNYPAYILALAKHIRTFWDKQGKPEVLLISFHGIPQTLVDAGDPYFGQCLKTGHLLIKALALPKQQWRLSFQSRMGPKAWLKPYTDQTLRELAIAGVKKVHVVCPGFSADCLETLDEIALEDREVFLQAGGESYHLIPCLNDTAVHIVALANIVEPHLAGWLSGLNSADRSL